MNYMVYLRNILIALLISIFCGCYSTVIASDFFKYERSFPVDNKYFKPENGVCSPVYTDSGSVFFYDRERGYLYQYTKQGYMINKINLSNSINIESLSEQIAVNKKQEVFIGSKEDGSLKLNRMSIKPLIFDSVKIDGFNDGRISGLSLSNENQILVQILDEENHTHVLKYDENLEKVDEVYLGEEYQPSLLSSSSGDAFILTKNGISGEEIVAADFHGLKKTLISGLNNFRSLAYDGRGNGRLIVYSRKYSSVDRGGVEGVYNYINENSFDISTYDLLGNFISKKTFDDQRYFPLISNCDNKFSSFNYDNGKFLIGDPVLGRILFFHADEDEVSLTDTWSSNSDFLYLTDVFVDDNVFLVSDFINGTYYFDDDFKKVNNAGMSVAGGDGRYYIASPFEHPVAYSEDFKNPLKLSYIANPSGSSEENLSYSHPYIINYYNSELYSAGLSGDVRVYDSLFGFKRKYTPFVPGGFMLDIEANDNGIYFIASDSSLYLYDQKTNHTRRIYDGSTDAAKGIAFDETGKSYVSFVGKDDRKNAGIKLFDPSISEELQTISSYGDLPLQVKYPRDIHYHDGRLYVADSGSNKVVVFRKLERPDKSKAIIIAGGDEYGNLLWDEAQANSNFAFWTLANQGYTKESIQYLNHNIELDLDQNGQSDDVDDVPNKANIKAALTEWAADADGEDVVLYMIGHGGKGTFQLGNNEILTVDELNEWLNELQAVMPGKVTVIYDACESGSFLHNLSGSPYQRTVITSAKTGENAYFQDAISFSHLFWNQVFSGKTISEAFLVTSEVIAKSFENQSPLLDSDGDGQSNTPNDYEVVAQQVIGSGTVYSGESPTIGNVTLTDVEKGKSTSIITAYDVIDDQEVKNVWGIVRPPHANLTQIGTPIQNFPRFDLTRQDDGTYQGIFDGFEQPGSYKLAIYAQDREGNTSIPEVVAFDVKDSLGRKAVLITGLTANGEFSDVLQAQTDHAYHALTGQGYADGAGPCTTESICYIGDKFIGSNVDRALDKEGLEDAITRWAISDTSDLVVYLAGDVVEGYLHLPNQETLSLSELETWLDDAQAGITGTLTLIHEGQGSGYLVAQLGEVAEGTERIVISSSAVGQNNYLINNGNVSFSGYFWSKVAQGGTVADAFVSAENRMRIYQQPQINSNGNSTSNEKKDRYKARYHHLGLGIVLAADEPVIGETAANITLSSTEEQAQLWAIPNKGLSALTKVWGEIEPPEYDPVNQQTGELRDVQLTNQGNGRWQADVTMPDAGVYAVHYYAQDVNGRLSAPRTHYVTQQQGADAYEPDDTFTDASYLSASTHFEQWHNFHNQDDVDYIRFTLDPDKGDYTFQVDSRGSETDVAFSLYDNQHQPIDFSSKSNTPIFTIDNHGKDSIERAYLKPEFVGEYYLKLQPSVDQQPELLGQGYRVSVFPSNANIDGKLEGVVKNKAGQAIFGAKVSNVVDNNFDRTDAQGKYTLTGEPGVKTIKVEAAGYEGESKQTTIIAGDHVDKDNPQAPLNFELSASDQPNPDDEYNRDDTPMIQSEKLPMTELPADYDYSQPVVMNVLQINVPEGGAELHQLTVKGSGTGNEATDIKAVKLYHDHNQNKQIDEGEDVQIGVTQTFTQDDGEITFKLTTPYSFQQGLQKILVGYSMGQ